VVKPYSRLEAQFRRIMTIESVADTLYRDQVAMMPEGGSSRRAEQLAVLNVVSHELLTAPQTNDWLAEVDEADLSSFEAANLREMRRKHLHATALEPDLVAAMSRNSTVCEAKWREARSGENFKLVAPLLAETVHLAREAAALRSIDGRLRARLAYCRYRSNF
jgi:carboxypeptidase Taq